MNLYLCDVEYPKKLHVFKVIGPFLRVIKFEERKTSTTEN